MRHPGENLSNLATVFCLAVDAASVCRHAQARQRRDRTVEYPKHLSKSNTVGRDAQHIASKFTTSALDNSVLLQFEQNLLKKLARDSLLRGDVGDYHTIAASKSH